MNLFLNILGFIWLLPATILVWLFYILPAWGLGLISYEQKEPDHLVWRFMLDAKKDNWLHRLYRKMWAKWWGWAGPCVMITTDYFLTDEFRKKYGKDDMDVIIRTIYHELRHCIQQFVFGIFNYPAYFLSSVFLWCFRWDKHAYLDNPFERDARAYAGQPVDIPPEQWMDGKDDRWPWW